MPTNLSKRVTNRPWSAGWGALALAGALAPLVVAHRVASWSSDPSDRAPIVWTSLLVIASLALMGRTAWGLVAALQSRRYHVFCGRRLLMCGLSLSALGVLLVAFLVIDDPFYELASRGQITTGVLVGLGCLVSAFLCLAGAGIALVSSWDAFDEERHWGRTIGVGR
jgi:hypothetical protein